MSDVPLGVFLSGGIDSSSVAASAARLRGAAGLHTFSIGFDDPSFDESAAARAVAATLRSTHHERIFGVTELIDRIRHVALAMDEPLGDPSMLPTHLLSEFAREHVTVALGGDGGDELLCGYATFRAERVARLYAQLPAFARRGVAAAVRRLPVSHGYMSLDFVAKRFVDGAAIPAERRHLTWLSSVVPGSADDPLHPELRERWGADEIFEEAESSYLDPVTGDDLERLSRQYSLNYLPGDILVKTDRASMANSLEVRSPFLDRDLVEFVAALPSQERISWLGGPKRILKRSMRGRIPDWVMRRRKQGFGLPIGRWLRGPLIPLCDELLAVERLRAGGHFEPVVVHRLLAEHRSGSHDHRKVLWTLLAFELWRDRHGLSG